MWLCLVSCFGCDIDGQSEIGSSLLIVLSKEVEEELRLKDS